MSHKLPNLSRIMRDYFDLTYNTVRLIEERLRFRFQLGCESSFHSTDLSKILIDLWVAFSKVMSNPESYTCFSVFGANSKSLYNCHNKAIELMELLRTCFNLIVTLNSFADEETEQVKLNVQQGNQEVENLFQNLYLQAFRSQEDQEYVLGLMQQIVMDNQQRPNFKTNVFNVLFKPMRKNDDEFENYTKNGDLGFVIEYMNDQRCLQNLMQSALNTYNHKLKVELLKLLENLLSLYDHRITYNMFQIVEA